MPKGPEKPPRPETYSSLRIGLGSEVDRNLKSLERLYTTGLPKGVLNEYLKLQKEFYAIKDTKSAVALEQMKQKAAEVRALVTRALSEKPGAKSSTPEKPSAHRPPKDLFFNSPKPEASTQADKPALEDKSEGEARPGVSMMGGEDATSRGGTSMLGIDPTQDPIGDRIRREIAKEKERKEKQVEEQKAQLQAGLDERAKENRSNMREGIARNKTRRAEIAANKEREAKEFLDAYAAANYPEAVEDLRVYESPKAGTEPEMELPGQRDAAEHLPARFMERMEEERMAAAELEKSNETLKESSEILESVRPAKDVAIDTPFLSASPEDRPAAGEGDKTPFEWRSMLRKLVSRAPAEVPSIPEQEPVVSVTEKPKVNEDWVDRTQNYLADRSDALTGGISNLLDKGKKFGRQTIEGARMLAWLSQDEKEPEVQSPEGKKFSQYLQERSKALGEKAKMLGPFAEKHFRELGERYNKLNWKYKLALGASLGLGAVAFSGVSALVAGTFGAGIGAQRIAGLAGMYLKSEKFVQSNQKFDSLSERQKKALAGALAIGYTSAMSATIGGAIHVASESAAGEAVQDWLRSFFTDKSVAPPVSESAPQTPAETEPAPEAAPIAPVNEAPLAPSSITEPTPEVLPPPIPDFAPVLPSTPSIEALKPPLEVAAPAESTVPAERALPEPSPVPESFTPGAVQSVSAPTEVSVVAEKGDGYIKMVKNMWEEVHKEGFVPPENLDPKSDLARLIAADKASLDTLAYKLSVEDGYLDEKTNDSTVVKLGEKMSFNVDGSLKIGDATSAPEGAPTTPTRISDEQMAKMFAEKEAELQKFHAEEKLKFQESAMPPIGEMGVVGPAPGMGPDAPLAEGLSDSGSTETPVPSQPMQGEVITNRYGLPVSVSEPHIYADSRGARLFIYGGTPQEQMGAIAAYLSQHPDQIVFGTDAEGKLRVPYGFDANGNIVPAGPPERTSGFFGFLSGWAKAPRPDEFKRLVF